MLKKYALISFRKKNKSSQILITALVVFAIGIALGVGFLTFSRTQYQVTQSQINSEKAYYLSASGIGKAIKELENDFDNYNGQIINFLDASSINISVGAEDSQGIRAVTIDSQYKNAYQKIEKSYRETIVYRPVCWVADYYNNRIIKLDSDGTVIATTTGFSRPTGVSVNSNTGECWVAVYSDNKVYKLDSDGTIIETVTGFYRPYNIDASLSPMTGVEEVR